jgi:hypothetical protein
MKSLRLITAIFVLSAASAAFAQSDAHQHKAADPSAPKSDAQKSFDTLKSLAGVWTAKLTLDPPVPDMDDNVPTQISLRVTSRGNAIVHEMYKAGVPDDPTKWDHPTTMLYVDGDRLTLVHYCDAGNRPRMVARSSPNGKTVEFDFVDISGGNEHGHMHHAVFTAIDANHHTEDWIYMLPNGKPMHAHFDLQRITTGSSSAGL